MQAIVCRDLRKEYRHIGVGGEAHVTCALDGLSFELSPGKLLGVLGPNGAGKTTLVKILSTILLADAGHVEVMGANVRTQVDDVRRIVGLVLGGDRGFYGRLSAFDNLRFFGSLYSSDRRFVTRRAKELLESFGLGDWAKVRVEEYSRGMKQRLHIARALLHEPAVLILDEPTIGLDPSAAKMVRDLVRSLGEQGKTIVMTTHYMFEADSLCDQILVVNQGRVVAEGAPMAIKAMAMPFEVFEIETFELSEDAITKLRKLAGVRDVLCEQIGQSLRLKVIVEPNLNLFSALLESIQGGGTVLSAGRKEASLEDAYLALLADGKEGH